MYYVLTTIFACALVVFGASNIDAGYLFTFAFGAGCFVLGHVVTDALDNPTV